MDTKMKYFELVKGISSCQRIDLDSPDLVQSKPRLATSKPTDDWIHHFEASASKHVNDVTISYIDFNSL